jgi:glutamate 5-kinase
MVLLTDMNGLYTHDPRTSSDATLIERLESITPPVEALAGGTGSSRGSGGMRSKLQAAKMASLSGVRAVIANAAREHVLIDAVAGRSVGTEVAAHDRGLTARKLWIGFAVESSGTLVVDDGARQALVNRNVSLLPAGIVGVRGTFVEGDAVDIVDTDGLLLARGLARYNAVDAGRAAGRRLSELGEEAAGVLVHRDDLVVLLPG